MKNSTAIANLHSEALAVVQRYKRSEVELIEVLQKADRFKVFYHYKFNSLFSYATDGLGLSSEVASIFIQVARKASEVPALKEEIQKGTITVSKARRMTAVLNVQNQKHWLEMAKTSSKRVLEKEVAACMPREAIRDQLNYVSKHQEIADKAKILKLQGSSARKSQVRVQLQAGVSEAVMLKLRRVQDLVSQKQKGAASLEKTLEAMIDLYLYHHDPIQKAKRQKIRGTLQNPKSEKDSTRNKMPSQSVAVQRSLRKALPASLRHSLQLKYNSQCAYVDEPGQRCQQRRHLEIHHILPVAQGGQDYIENLTLYCSGHHRAHHQEEMTLHKMTQLTRPQYNANA